MFPMKRFHHRFLLDSQNSAIRQCGCRAHPESLPRQRTFTEEVPAP